MRLGRLHPDTTDQYWELTDLNSSQELFSYGRYIIHIHTLFIPVLQTINHFTPISYPEYTGSLIGGGSPGVFCIGHSPFTTVISAVKKYYYFKGFPDDQLLTNGRELGHSGYENAFNLPQPVYIVPISDHVMVLLSIVTYCVKTYTLKWKHEINVHDKSYIL